MRLLMLTLCALVAAAPSAQTQVADPVLEGYRLLLADGTYDPSALDPGSTVSFQTDVGGPDVYSGTVVSLLSAPAGMVGGMTAVAALFVADVMVISNGASESRIVSYAPAWIGGSAVGAAAAVWMMGRQTGPDGLLPAPDIRRDDWKRALVGIALGTVAGAAVMYSAPGWSEPDAPVWPIFAVPVLQGVGAGVAVGLR